MSLQQLKYIVALDEHRHFAKAAEACSVAQPTLTLQVKKFEHELGVELFDRSSKPLRPTPIASLVLSKARGILKSVDELHDILSNEQEIMEGNYRLGIIPTLAPYLLPRFIDEFMQNHPSLSLEIEEQTSLDIIEALNNGRLDLGILATPLEEKRLKEIPLFEEPFVVFADADHSILTGSGEARTEDLRAEDLWLLGETHCLRHQSLNLCQERPKNWRRQLKMEAGSIETIKRMIKGGKGYTLIPELAVDRSSDSAHTRVISNDGKRPVRQISLVVRNGFIRQKLLSELVLAITRNIPPNYLDTENSETIKWRRQG